MTSLRSPKVQVLLLIIIGIFLYILNSKPQPELSAEILSYDFNEQPGHITVDVRIGNRSMQPTTFSAFSLHCSDMDDNVITFKVLNNDANASGDLTTMPLTVAAENTTNITLLAEKNTSYTSPADCQKMLVSWKVKNGKNQTGTPLTIAN